MGFEHVHILENGCDLNKFDYIIFDLGAEFSGSLNLFGGLDEKVYQRLKEISTFTGRLFSWRNQLPKVSEALKGRMENKSTCDAFKKESPDFLNKVQNVLDKTEVFDHAYKTDALLIGDSHTPSVWGGPNWMIERRDGRTLDGMIKNNTIAKYLKLMPWVKHLHVHCSSIDVRHHWCRMEDSEQSAASAVINIVSQIHDFDDQLETVTLNYTVGIENENRKLPKTGYFKGSAFYGSWAQRNMVRTIFNEVINEYTKDCPGWSKVEYPPFFFNGSGQMMEEYMEVPGSVHTSPEWYRYDLDKNELRWK